MSSDAEMMEMVVVTFVSVPPFFVHILELGHKSSYFQSTNRLDPYLLPESVNFTQQNIPCIGEKRLLDFKRKSMFNLCFYYNT